MAEAAIMAGSISLTHNRQLEHSSHNHYIPITYHLFSLVSQTLYQLLHL